MCSTPACWRHLASSTLRFDLDEPTSLDAGPDGGLLRDLGSHLVDQALWLLGPANRVTANMDWVDLPAGRTDAGFVVTITHAGGAHSHLSSSKVNGVESRELRLFGSLGSYVSSQSDVQAQASFAGVRPIDDPRSWGYEAKERWGTLATADGTRRVPSAQGSYTDYYTRFAAAVAGADLNRCLRPRRSPHWRCWMPPGSAPPKASPSLYDTRNPVGRNGRRGSRESCAPTRYLRPSSCDSASSSSPPAISCVRCSRVISS